MDKTKIDWCDSTWNPVTGCLHGCEYCYARGIAERFGAGWETASGNLPVLDEILYGHRMGKDGKPERRKEVYPYNFTPTFHRYRLNDYIGKQGRNIFVCSMADLFGEWVPDSWIEEVFKACEKVTQHNYLFLTKNPKRYIELAESGKLPQKDNMWYGSTVTAMEEYFSSKNTFNTFLSIEPMHTSISPSTISGVKWIIFGAETGRRKDKVIPERKWIEDIVNECRKSNIPVFMKSSLADIWGEPLIQEFPEELKGGEENMCRCEQCKNYAALHTPRMIKDDIRVYGFCFKDLHENYGSAHPVYIPDGGVCKSFSKKQEKKENYEYEMIQEFKCECCKKNLIGKISKCIEKL